MKNDAVGPMAKLSAPKEGWENSTLRLRFMHAGLREKSWPALFFAAKTVLALVFGACWLFDRVSELQLSHDTGALVYAIQEPVGYLNPLVPSIGVTGEVTDLIFEPR